MSKTIEENITRKSGSSFYYTFLFLPEKKKKAMHTVYAFCRITDDIVDTPEATYDEKLKNLEEWKFELENALRNSSRYELLNSLAQTINELNLSTEPFFELIEGVKMDLTKHRYETFDELKLYCYRVASTIGLMSIELFGYKNPLSRDYAYNLGIAMQLTNILRDIKVDAEQDRIYIPKEDLIKFNYPEDDLINYKYNPNFIELMKFECDRAEDYYRKADECFPFDDRKNLAMGKAMEEIYHKILMKIRKNKFNVFTKNNNLSKPQKILITLKNFIKYQYLK
jgi:phytoene synthase